MFRKREMCVDIAATFPGQTHQVADALPIATLIAVLHAGVAIALTSLLVQPGRRAIAEGIRDRETLRALRNLGSDAVQAYYFGRSVKWTSPVLRDGILGREFEPVAADEPLSAEPM